MNQKLINAINRVRDKAAELQKDIDVIDEIRDLTPGERQMAKEAGNSMRGFRAFALNTLANAAGIENFEM